MNLLRNQIEHWFFQRFGNNWLHKVFNCPTYWSLHPAFICPDCSGTYRCYWQGHDCSCGTINLCGRCEPKHRTHKALAA